MGERTFFGKKCTPCEKGAPPLKADLAHAYLKELDIGWAIVGGKLEKEYLFADFTQALAFANKIGEAAEAQAHHPDLYISYGKVKVELWTHKISGLSENDFILAADCDYLHKHLDKK